MTIGDKPNPEGEPALQNSPTVGQENEDPAHKPSRPLQRSTLLCVYDELKGRIFKYSFTSLLGAFFLFYYFPTRSANLNIGRQACRLASITAFDLGRLPDIARNGSPDRFFVSTISAQYAGNGLLFSVPTKGFPSQVLLLAIDSANMKIDTLSRLTRLLPEKEDILR